MLLCVYQMKGLLFEWVELWTIKDLFGNYLSGGHNKLKRFNCIKFDRDKKEVVVTNQYTIFQMVLSLPNDITWDDLLVGFNWDSGPIYIAYDIFFTLKNIAAIKWNTKKKVAYLYDKDWNHSITDEVYNESNLREQEVADHIEEEEKNLKKGKKISEAKDWSKYLQPVLNASLDTIIGSPKSYVMSCVSLKKFINGCTRLGGEETMISIGKDAVAMEVLGNDKNYRLIRGVYLK